ncbi:MAG: xanthine permease [Spartobacteria bacterium]|nr:xanthine permease [Spartobacteria bacterium]
MSDQNQLLYKLDDRPPFGTLLLLSIQQMMIMFTAATFPAILVREVGGDIQVASAMVSLTMVAAGIGSVIQAYRGRWMGSGYLCPNICGPSYLSVSMQAAWMGGFPLMRGMIIFAGIIEILLANVVSKLKFLFPPLIVGLVVTFVGINVLSVSVTNFFGQAYLGDSISWKEIAVGVIALFTMVGCNLWGRGVVRLYCLLIGIAVGWCAALVFTPEVMKDMALLKTEPFFAQPFRGVSLFAITFRWNIALPFFIIAVCGSLKSFGNLVAAQKISEPDLKEMNMKPIAKGLVADGFTTAMAGAMGALAVDTSSSNVGLAAATRAVSRSIAICAGVLFTILGFFPKLSTAIALVPRPVVGACMIFAISMMISAGFKESFSEPLDQRKSFVLGISLIFGLSTEFLAPLYAMLPHWSQPLFGSPLATVTIFSIVLYQLFHLDEYLKK